MNMTIEQKKKQLENVISKMKGLKSNLGMKIGFGDVEPIEYYETPFVTLNTLLGGGLPKGRFSVIAGPAMTGKTTLLQQVIAYQQSIDPEFICLWTDAENSLEPTWCEKLGIDTERLLVQRYPDNVEGQYFEKLLQQGFELIETGSINMWVIDSIGALTPKSEVDKELEDGKMLDLQRKLGEFFRKANPVAAKNNCACVMVGQVYDAPTTTGITLQQVKGGNAVKHWAYTRLITRRGRKDLGPGDHDIPQPDGNKKRVPKGWAQAIKLEKTKTNDKENQEVILQFMFGRGFDSIDCAIGALFANEIIIRKGGWFYNHLFPEDKSGDCKIQGKDNVVEFLKSAPDVLAQLTHEMDLELAVSTNQNNTQDNT